VQNRCKELGVGYIDLNGTFGLIRGGLHIDIVRPATAFKSPQGIKNVFTGRSRRIIRALLVNPHQPFRLEQLASETDVSVGQVFHVFKRLEQDGLLDRTTEGRALTKPRKLLQIFAASPRVIMLRIEKFSTVSPNCRLKSLQHLFATTAITTTYAALSRFQVDLSHPNETLGTT
jgi:hypothetical protein